LKSASWQCNADGCLPRPMCDHEAEAGNRLRRRRCPIPRMSPRICRSQTAARWSPCAWGFGVSMGATLPFTARYSSAYMQRWPMTGATPLDEAAGGTSIATDAQRWLLGRDIPRVASPRGKTPTFIYDCGHKLQALRSLMDRNPELSSDLWSGHRFQRTCSSGGKYLTSLVSVLVWTGR
jgi:hypothetical protein